MAPTSRTALLAATLAALTIPAGVTRANVVDVPFSLTITQSPFASGNLAVGKTITGRYGYEPVTSPAVAGPNYVKYTLSHGQIGIGTDACTSTSVALDLSHAIGLGDSPELGLVDLYEVTFYSLQ